MKNKYVIYMEKSTYNKETERFEDSIAEREIVADQVANNDGYLTFFNLDTTVTPPKAVLVEILGGGQWDRVVNAGPFIPDVPSTEVGDNG